MNKRLGHLVLAGPNWVGDVAIASPVFEAATRSARFERVTITLREHLLPLVAGAPYADCVRGHAGRTAELKLWRSLEPDALLLLSNSFGAAWRAFRSGAKLRAGSALHGRRRLLTHAVRPPRLDGRRMPMPAAHLMRDVAGLFGIYPDNLHPRLYVEPGAREAAHAGLTALGFDASRPYVLCAPGAAFGTAKLWPPERFAAALDALAQRHGFHAVLSGTQAEEPLLLAVQQACSSSPLVVPPEARNLSALKALIAASSLVLVGDSGPRWVAAAFDVPCVTLLGPNGPQNMASSLEHCEEVWVRGLECFPCGERDCPLGHHQCMRSLPVESVLAAAERALASRAASTVAPAQPAALQGSR